MALELAQVVTGFPLVASFAIAGGIAVLREGRRRASLNAAVHELRRPLQVMALSLPADSGAAGGLDSSLRLAAAAVDRLESEINGARPQGEVAPVAVGSLVEATVERWRGRAALEGRSLSLRWRAGDSLVTGDEIELLQTVDNMINNAFEHGSGAVVVEVRESGGRLRLAVLDSGSSTPSPRSGGRSLRARVDGRARHGHGLKIARRAAARHGGDFRLRCSSRGTEARLELPLAGGAR
ncbi:MAG TPA: ATP-binding protein [Solirubrobacterales bacterium]|nr:ATP-binding protein [Solirubrobacterales bacterium]